MRTIRRSNRLHRKQLDFHKSSATYRGFVGGRGAGKSWIGAFDLIQRARRGRTYMVGSPTGILLQDTTYPTFKAIVQGLGLWSGVKLTPYPNVWTTTGAVIRFRTAEDPEKMRGPNLSGVWLDEASLMHRDAYLISIACLREAGEQGWLSATFTPKGMAHWTYEVFGALRPDTEIFHAPTKDNPFNPPDFAATLARQYGDGAFAQQELGGEWTDDEDAWQVIPTAWVKAAQGRWTPQRPTGQCLTCIGADIARGGADWTVAACRYGAWIAPPKKYQGACTDDGPKAADLILRDHTGDAPVNIDAIGLGSSAYDAAKARIGALAVAVNVSAASDRFDRLRKYKLTNVRAALWWTMREALNPDPTVGDSVMLPPGNEVLADLTAPRFEVRTNGIKIEEKSEIKKRIGRSPDVGDAIALTFVPKKREFVLLA